MKEMAGGEDPDANISKEGVVGGKQPVFFWTEGRRKKGEAADRIRSDLIRSLLLLLFDSDISKLHCLPVPTSFYFSHILLNNFFPFKLFYLNIITSLSSLVIFFPVSGIYSKTFIKLHVKLYIIFWAKIIIYICL